MAAFYVTQISPISNENIDHIGFNDIQLTSAEQELYDLGMEFRKVMLMGKIHFQNFCSK